VEGYSWGISWKWGIILPEWAGKEFGFSKKTMILRISLYLLW